MHVWLGDSSLTAVSDYHRLCQTLQQYWSHLLLFTLSSALMPNCYEGVLEEKREMMSLMCGSSNLVQGEPFAPGVLRKHCKNDLEHICHLSLG